MKSSDFSKKIGANHRLLAFLSWVVLSAVVMNMFNLDGSITQMLEAIGLKKNLNFLGSNKLFNPCWSGQMSGRSLAIVPDSLLAAITSD